MKDLYIIRGLPGSGKSSVAKEISFRFKLLGKSFYYPHFEVDKYFCDENGNYYFNADNLMSYHNRCFNDTEKSLQRGIKKVIVSNTTTLEEDVNLYINLAKKYNYRYFVIVVENRHNGIDKHNVPLTTLEKMNQQLKQSIQLINITNDVIINKIINSPENNENMIIELYLNDNLKCETTSFILIITERLDHYICLKVFEIQSFLQLNYKGIKKDFAIENKSNPDFSILMDVINHEYNINSPDIEIIKNSIKKNIIRKTKSIKDAQEFLNDINKEYDKIQVNIKHIEL
jgi:predicted kinase